MEGDPVRLEQVVSNLLTNALKYTPRGGHVDVTVKVEGAAGEVRVADDGVGIDADVLPRIFELFAQDDNTLDRSRGGLGVGLTLVRSLVALHGGTVVAESEGRGRGSAFTVRLPRVTGKQTASAPHDDAAHAAAHAAARPLTVLVIDDNHDVRIGLGDLLRSAGHEVLVSARGEEGIELALARRPHAILIDIGLPGLDGYAVARRLREAFSDSVRLVALTGYGSTEDRKRAFASGFDEHVTKPTTLAVLNRVLSVQSPGRASASGKS